MKKKKKKVKAESGFVRITICIPPSLSNWIDKQKAKTQFAGNKSSFFRNAVLAYKTQLKT